MRSWFVPGIVTLFIAAWMAACSAPGTASTVVATQPLLPYQSPTASPTIQDDVQETEALPTPTPLVYTVVAGDTLFAIAARHEITVQTLMAVNPNVDPLLLSPGMELFIPAAGGAVSVIPTPTPAAAQLGGVNCFSSTLGELWCFLLVKNTNEAALENLIGTVQLVSADGEVLARLEAVPPLNILLPDQAMPLVAYQSKPPAGWVEARGQLLSAYVVPEQNDIYLNVNLSGVEVEISQEGLSARVTGQARLAAGQSAGLLWVLAVAYDQDGNVVGVRRWESRAEAQFDFWVYSLGPKIAEVELLAEARP
ncbi:MAG TPA: LysM domain-containing protein [Anaerolineales bacterium]